MPDIVETVTVNGMPMDAEPVGPPPPPPERYVVVEKGKAVDALMYDGVSPFKPGRGTLVREADWKGAAPEVKEPADVKATRTRADRVNALATRLDEDIKGWDALTAPQRTAATLRGLRLVRALVRELRSDDSED